MGPIGCVAAIIGGLGITVAGFSIGEWLLAIVFVGVTTPPPNPADEAWVKPGATRVVHVSSEGAVHLRISASIDADRPLNDPGGKLVVFARADAAPSHTSLSALAQSAEYTIGQVVEGVGEVVALSEAPVEFSSSGPRGTPKLRVERSGYFTLLVLDEPTFVSVTGDLAATKRDCNCEPIVKVEAVPL